MSEGGWGVNGGAGGGTRKKYDLPFRRGVQRERDGAIVREHCVFLPRTIR